MIHKLSALITLSVGLGLNLVSHVLLNPLQFGFCRKTFLFGDRLTCVDNITLSIGEPLKIYAFALIAIGVALLLVRNKEVRQWLWFAIPWSILTFFAVYNVPTLDPGFYMVQKDTVSIGMAAVFVFVSLVFIAYKLFKSRKNGTKLTA